MLRDTFPRRSQLYSAHIWITKTSIDFNLSEKRNVKILVDVFRTITIGRWALWSYRSGKPWIVGRRARIRNRMNAGTHIDMTWILRPNCTVVTHVLPNLNTWMSRGGNFHKHAAYLRGIAIRTDVYKQNTRLLFNAIADRSIEEAYVEQ